MVLVEQNCEDLSFLNYTLGVYEHIHIPQLVRGPHSKYLLMKLFLIIVIIGLILCVVSPPPPPLLLLLFDIMFGFFNSVCFFH